MRIVFREDLCASIGMCESLAPDVFEIGDDGELHIHDFHPAECHRKLIEQAVASCPNSALSIEE